MSCKLVAKIAVEKAAYAFDREFDYVQRFYIEPIINFKGTLVGIFASMIQNSFISKFTKNFSDGRYATILSC